MEILQIMEGITVVVTLLMFLTGISPCIDMYNTGNTKNVPYMLFVLSVISCEGMLHYGMLIGNSTLIFLNGVGLLLQLLYIGIYIVLIKSKTRPLSEFMAALFFLAALYWYLYNIVKADEEIKETIGAVSSLITTFIMVLPVFEIIDNIRNKNADGMPMVMLIGGLLCSISWLIYGLMLNDFNVYVPNIPGIVITVIKMYMVMLYQKKSKTH